MRPLRPACALLALVSLGTPVLHASADTPLPEGQALAVRGRVRVAAREYLRPPLGADGRGGVIVIEKQKKVELDLTGVELRGAPRETDLDQLTGWGIVIRDCEDVVVKGGKLGGYKGCVVAVNTKGLVLEGLAFDGWYGMRLRSTVDAEDPSDWLFPHENDADQWITQHGAAISLTDCPGATIRNCTGRRGQNGILLTRSNEARIEKNDFSFLSGWGLALYRSSRALVTENTFDYCVRGYSHDVYWRGQDSAGILMFERCSDNVFAWNSATHGGDGVFLFAGMDTVEGRAFAKGELDAGGSDRNIWYGNDFSFAVANAIEATFSADNWAISNRLDGSHQHGVWGGYSRNMVILLNSIEGTAGNGISIEHGQDCAIVGNSLARNETALELWWDEDKELVQGPFGKHRDTSSRDTLVRENRFAGNRSDVSLRDTKVVRFERNTFAADGELALVDVQGAEAKAALEGLRDPDGHRPSGRIERSTLAAPGSRPPDHDGLRRALAWKPPAETERARQLAERWRKPGAHREGLETIVMGEWGPWDFRSGAPRPVERKSGGLLADAKWDAKWFSWKSAADPREDLAGWRKLAAKPALDARVSNFSDPYGRQAALKKELGNARFGLIAKTTVRLAEKGRYRLAVLSDDGVRVTVDGKKAVENWTHHAPTRDETVLELARGEHTLDLEYFQIDGALALRVELEKVP